MTPPHSDFEPPLLPGKTGKSGTVQISRGFIIGIALLIIVLAVSIGFLVSKLADQTTATTGTSPVASKSTVVVKSPGPTAVPATATPDQTIKVNIIGEVQHPGVYEMQPGDRVIDAITAAGGFTDRADQTRLDLAQRVKDEMQIQVPGLPSTTIPPNVTPPSITSTATSTIASTLVSQPTPNGAGASSTSKINVNTASAADLDKLPGIGITLSQRIVDYRTANGPYQTLDDLRKVPGLTKSEIDKIKDLISF